MALTTSQIVKKLSIWLAASLAAIMFLAVFAFGVVASLAYEGSKNGQLQSWVDQTFNANVDFQAVKVTWRSFYPTVILKNIQISSDDSQKNAPAISLDQVEVNVNILQSILKMRPVAHAIILQGLQVNLTQNPDGSISLVGFVGHQGNSFSWEKVWPWLQNQEWIKLTQSKIYITRQDNSQLTFNNVEFSWHRIDSTHYQLATNVDMLGSMQNQISLKAEINGNLAKPSSLNVLFYTDVQSEDFSPLFKHYAVYQLNLVSAGGRIQSWGQWSENTLQRLHLVFDLSNIQLSDAKQGVNIAHFDENLLWQRQANQGWQLLMQEYLPNGSKQSSDNNHLFISYTPQADSQEWSVQCTSVDLEMLSSLLEFWKKAPVHFLEALEQLAPQGQLVNTDAQWTTQGNKLISYNLEGSLQNLAINSWNQVPGFSGLQVNFHITPNQGDVELGGDQFTLSPNLWFAKGWPASHLSLVLSWQQQDKKWLVYIHSLGLKNNWLNLAGQGKLFFTNQDYSNPHIRFLAGFTGQNAEQIIANYIPTHGISENLSAWLQHAFTLVPNLQGGWVWSGNLHDLPYASNQGKFEILANAQNVSIEPWLNWPAITGIDASIKFNGPNFTVVGKQGTSLGTTLRNMTLSLHHLGGPLPKQLAIESDVHTSGLNIRNYFINTPLAQNIAPVLNTLILNGALSGHVKILIPIKQTKAHIEVSGKVNFSNNQLIVGHAPWIVNNIQGSFSFSPTALHSNGLSANFFGDPLQIIMNTTTRNGTVSQNIDLKGILNLAAIDQLAPPNRIKWWKLASGNAPFNFKISASTKKLIFDFASNLTGISINLPPPFNKGANTPLELKITAVGINKKNTVPVTFHLGNWLAGQMLWTSNGKSFGLTNGIITVNPKTHIVTLPKTPGILINGNLAYLSIEQWVDALKLALPNKATSKTLDAATATPLDLAWFNKISLNVGYLNVYGRLFNDLTISMKYTDNIWQVGVAGEQAQGFIDLPQNWAKPVYKAQFSHLTLAKEATEQKPSSANSQFTGKNLAKLPGLAVSIKQFTWGQQLIGTVNLDMQPLPSGINIKQLQINNADITALIQGQIVGHGDVDAVSMAGNLDGKNWGNALTSFGYPDFMQNGSGPIDFQLSWQGLVNQPKLPSIEGNVSFNLKNGSLSKLNPGLIKLLGLFSLDSLLKHLSFNFSDVTNKGLAFDSLKGDYVIHNSIASTQDFRLTGPSLDLILMGQVNLAEQTLDQTVTVIPQVGGSLALAATLIGGPIAGAATWVADKVISNTLLKDRGIVYRVTGAWDKPTVTSAS